MFQCSRKSLGLPYREISPNHRGYQSDKHRQIAYVNCEKIDEKHLEKHGGKLQEHMQG